MKLKLYAVSLMAVNRIHEPSENEAGVVYWEHWAELLTSDSAEGVSFQAKEIAFSRWPKELGWEMHSATVVPVTLEFYSFMRQMIQQGHLVGEHLPAEMPRLFNFFDGPAVPDYQPVVGRNDH